MSAMALYACTTLGFVCVFFPGVFLHFRVTGACPVTTDLIMRVNVRATTTIKTTTTTTTTTTVWPLCKHLTICLRFIRRHFDLDSVQNA